MLIPLLQVSLTAIRTISRSAFNIMLYSVLSSIFKWFGFNSFISFVCSVYCLSKIVDYLQRIWLNARLKNKKSNERFVITELIWASPTTITIKLVKHIFAFGKEFNS